MPELAFATSEDAATVTAIDLAARRAVATLPAAPGAHGMAFTPDGARLFVVNRRGRSVTVVYPRAPARLATIELPVDPVAAAVSPDGSLLAVLGRTRLVAWLSSVFDTDGLAPAGEVALPGARGMGHGCFVTEDGASFWAISNGAGHAYCIDTARLTVAATIPVGPNSQDIAHRWRDAFA